MLGDVWIFAHNTVGELARGRKPKGYLLLPSLRSSSSPLALLPLSLSRRPWGRGGRARGLVKVTLGLTVQVLLLTRVQVCQEKLADAHVAQALSAFQRKPCLLWLLMVAERAA